MVKYLLEHTMIVDKLIKQSTKIQTIIDLIVNAYRNGKKVIVFGNGGSAVDAEHFVTELVSKFKLNRKGLNALSLTSNNAILTAIGNDFNYDEVFSRQVVAYVQPDDVVIGLSTSGTSLSVLNGLDKAKELKAIPILITGNRENNNYLTLNINSTNTPRIQEVYMLVIHIICEEVEKELFANE